LGKHKIAKVKTVQSIMFMLYYDLCTAGFVFHIK